MFCCSRSNSSSSKPAIFACFVVNSIPTVLAVIGVLGLLHQHHIVNLQGLNSLSQGASIALLTTGSFFISLQLLALYKFNSRTNLPALSDPQEFAEEIKKLKPPRFMRMVSEGVFEEEIIDTDKITEDLQKSQYEKTDHLREDLRKSPENALIEQTRAMLRDNVKLKNIKLNAEDPGITIFVSKFPNDLFFLVFRQLSEKDLTSVAKVCKKFNAVVSEMRRIKTSRETPIVSSGSQRSEFGKLPSELIHEILKHLDDGNDLVRVAIVCKKFSLVVKEEIILRDRIQETFFATMVLHMSGTAFGCSESYQVNCGGAILWIKPNGKLMSIVAHDQGMIFFNKKDKPINEYTDESYQPKDCYSFALEFRIHNRKTQTAPKEYFSIKETFFIFPEPKIEYPEKVKKTVKAIETGVKKQVSQKIEEISYEEAQKRKYYLPDYPWGLLRGREPFKID